MLIIMKFITILLSLVLSSTADTMQCIDVVKACAAIGDVEFTTPSTGYKPQLPCEDITPYFKAYECLEEHYDACLGDFKFASAIFYEYQFGQPARNCLISSSCSECSKADPIINRAIELLHAPCKLDFETCIALFDEQTYQQGATPGKSCDTLELSKRTGRVNTWKCLTNEEIMTKCLNSRPLTSFLAQLQSPQNCGIEYSDCRGDCQEHEAAYDNLKDMRTSVFVSLSKNPVSLTVESNLSSSSAIVPAFTGVFFTALFSQVIILLGLC